MNLITYYKLKRELKAVEPQEQQESVSLKKRMFLKIFKFFRFVFWKMSFLGVVVNWINKRTFGVVVVLFTIVMFIAIIIANQLRYYYWENIMRSNYPNDVLVVVDKALFEFNAPMVTLHYWIYMLVIGIIWVSFNKKYCSSKGQVIPRLRKP